MFKKVFQHSFIELFMHYLTIFVHFVTLRNVIWSARNIDDCPHDLYHHSSHIRRSIGLPGNSHWILCFRSNLHSIILITSQTKNGFIIKSKIIPTQRELLLRVYLQLEWDDHNKSSLRATKSELFRNFNLPFSEYLTSTSTSFPESAIRIKSHAAEELNGKPGE